MAHEETEFSPISLDKIPQGVDEEDAPLLEYTNFSRKDWVRQSGGLIYGNWSASFAGACISGTLRTIQAGSVIEIGDVGRCDSGLAIVRCKSY